MGQPWPVLLLARELGLGGSERQLCETAKALDTSSFQPHVACFRGGGFRADELRAAGVPILDLSVRSFASWSAIAGALALKRYIRRHQIRLVHAFDAPLNLFSVPLGRLFGVPVVISSQRCHRELTPGLTRHLLRLTDLMVDAVVVNSQMVRRHLIDDERVSPGLIQVCYNGVDLDRFQPGPRRRPPCLAGATVVVGVVCAFRPEKGLPVLLEAFAQLLHAKPGVRLLLVGGGPDLESLRELSRRLGLDGACHFEPATNEVAAWLRAIDVFVLPSLSEALSNSLLEAMACGCCALASDVGGNPELVTHDQTGLLFLPGDVAGLTACLRRVVEQDGLRNQLAAAGACFVRRNFSLEASARRMAAIYTELIESQAGRPPMTE